AAAGSDYGAASGTLTFAAGETSKTVTVQVLGDTTFEADETFSVVLSDSANAALGTAAAAGTVVNDDGRPVGSVAGVTLAEGDAGTSQAVFTLTLSNASSETVTVSYATADGTAQAGTDFQAAGGTVTFTPGQTTASVAVAVLGETDLEADETFTLALSSP